MSKALEILKAAKERSNKERSKRDKQIIKSTGDFKYITPVDLNNQLGKYYRVGIENRIQQLIQEFNRLNQYLVPPKWFEGVVIISNSKTLSRFKKVISLLIKLNIPVGGVVLKKEEFYPKRIEFEVDNSTYLINEWDYTLENFFTEYEVSSTLLKYFNSLWEKMSDEELAFHLSSLIPNRRRNRSWSEGSCLFIKSDGFRNFPLNTLRVNLSEGVVYFGQTLKVSPITAVELHQPLLLDGRQALAFLILGLLSRGPSSIYDERYVTGYLQRACTLWLPPDNYGIKRKPFNLNGTIKNHITKPIMVELTSGSYPPIRLKGVEAIDDVPISSRSLLEAFLLQGIPAAPDKYGQYRKGLKTGAGAEAMGIGIYSDTKGSRYIVNVSADQDKPYKNLNRPGTFFGANIADSPANERSLLRFQTEEGVKYREGIPVKALVTNSCLGHGDGVACVNPATSFSYSVDTVLKGEVPKTSIPPYLKDKLRRQSASLSNDTKYLMGLVEPLRKAIKLKVNPERIYSYGDVIVSIWKGDYQYPAVSLKKPNCNFQPYPIEDDDISYNYERDSITIRVRGKLIEKSEQDIKARGPGIKCTLHPEYIEFLNNSEQWDIFFPMGALKGRLNLLFMWVDSLGIPATYNPHECKLTFEREVTQDKVTFSEVNILGEDNPWEDWIKRETKIIKVKREVAKHILLYAYNNFPHHIQFPGESKPNADVVILEETPSGYFIEETIQVISGKYHINIEVSTPRENTGIHGLTLEQLLRLELLYPPLAELVVNSSRELHKSVERLVGYNAGAIKLRDNEILTKEQVIQKIEDKLEGITNPHKGLRILSRLFPNGLIINTNPNEGYYPFDLLISYGSWIGGGIEEAVLSLFKNLKKDSIIVDQENVVLHSQIMTWARSRMYSLNSSRSKILGRLGKTAPVCGGSKAKTSHHPIIEGGDLPIAIIHPDDSILDLTNTEEGDIVILGRNPLGSMAFFKVKLSREYGSIAHIKISALISNMASESDGDGDPIFLLPVNKLDRGSKKPGIFIDEQLAYTLNRSILCLGGYYKVHREEPFRDFISFKAKWSSKILSSSQPSPLVKVKVRKPLPTLTSIEDYLDLTEKTCEHYTYGVGRGYNFYSALVVLMANERSKEYNKLSSNTKSEVEKVNTLESNESLMALQLAMVVSERIFYEDLGLGGYKPKSNALLTLVDTIVRHGNFQVLKASNGTYHQLDKSSALVQSGLTFNLVDGREELALSIFGGTNTTVLRVIDKLLYGASLVLLYQSIENDGKIAQELENTPQVHDAIICGAGRRLGQGNTNPNGEGISTLSLTFDYFSAGVADKVIHSKSLLDILQRGSYVISLVQSWHEQQQQSLR